MVVHVAALDAVLVTNMERALRRSADAQKAEENVIII